MSLYDFQDFGDRKIFFMIGFYKKLTKLTVKDNYDQSCVP